MVAPEIGLAMTKNGNPASDSIILDEYVRAIQRTDRLSQKDLRPVLMGLFGEVGSIMAPAKKAHREKDAYQGYQDAVEEEFGDALWYFSALATRLNHNLSDLFSHAVSADHYQKIVAAGTLPTGPIVHISSPKLSENIDEALLELGQAGAELLSLRNDSSDATKLLQKFAAAYLNALSVANANFSRVLKRNLAKVSGRFLKPDPTSLPDFDSDFDPDERLPEKFEIVIKQRPNGQSCLLWNGVFIGDPLTDNIHDTDDYRFHDVFHFAHAAILHWSPTFRALIKHKRKSDKRIDEAQDGGRAIVVEEGLTAWLYSRSKALKYFEGQDSVSLDLLKTISEFVRGYEVESCPLNLWENAILQGYEVFREVRKHNGGIVVGDRVTRTIGFRPLPVTK